MTKSSIESYKSGSMFPDRDLNQIVMAWHFANTSCEPAHPITRKKAWSYVSGLCNGARLFSPELGDDLDAELSFLSDIAEIRGRQ